jgi:AcrR family transcriptional regulator
VTARILEIGRAHLAEEGAAGLSLRAVTRDLGMVSSAVYRYVANRDDLLTLLVVDAYTELADAVDAALAELDQPDELDRLDRLDRLDELGGSDAARGQVEAHVLALAGAVRAWGLAEPSRFALLYGSPVPGYDAPGEQTIGPGTRVMRRLVDVLDAGVRDGDLPVGSGPVPVPADLALDLAATRSDLAIEHADDAVVASGIFLWTAMIGAVSAEVFGQFGEDAFRARTSLFEHGIRLALTVLRG